MHFNIWRESRLKPIVVARIGILCYDIKDILKQQNKDRKYLLALV